MTLEEFSARTGCYPDAELFTHIGMRYMESDMDKDQFCAAYAQNLDGLAQAVQQEADRSYWQEYRELTETIGALKAENRELRQQLEQEQEWRPMDPDSCLSEAEYAALCRADIGTRTLTDEEALGLLNAEFGFEPALVRILRELPAKEANRHHELRDSGRHVRRAPAYNATDWNYIRFSCRDRDYEMVNGELRKA